MNIEGLFKNTKSFVLPKVTKDTTLCFDFIAGWISNSKNCNEKKFKHVLLIANRRVALKGKPQPKKSEQKNGQEAR